MLWTTGVLLSNAYRYTAARRSEKSASSARDGCSLVLRRQTLFSEKSQATNKASLHVVMMIKEKVEYVEGEMIAPDAGTQATAEALPQSFHRKNFSEIQTPAKDRLPVDLE
jgi:hypothetical protein